MYNYPQPTRLSCDCYIPCPSCHLKQQYFSGIKTDLRSEDLEHKRNCVLARKTCLYIPHCMCMCIVGMCRCQLNTYALTVNSVQTSKRIARHSGCCVTVSSKHKQYSMQWRTYYTPGTSELFTLLLMNMLLQIYERYKH